MAGKASFREAGQLTVSEAGGAVGLGGGVTGHMKLSGQSY